jgi:hypothetical protein
MRRGRGRGPIFFPADRTPDKFPGVFWFLEYLN